MKAEAFGLSNISFGDVDMPEFSQWVQDKRIKFFSPIPHMNTLTDCCKMIKIVHHHELVEF